jgi:hypothetical protein
MLLVSSVRLSSSTLTKIFDSVTALLVNHDDTLSEDDSDEILKRMGAGRNRWVSFTADDLDAIAPWLDDHIEKRMEGMGLGN